MANIDLLLVMVEEHFDEFVQTLSPDLAAASQDGCQAALADPNTQQALADAVWQFIGTPEVATNNQGTDSGGSSQSGRWF